MTVARPTPDLLDVFDVRGRRRSAANMPGYRTGRPPANKGRKFPADPPTIEEVVLLLRACEDTPYGLRRRALLILLWRAGLRIALPAASRSCSVSASASLIVVRHGKGGKRRIVGIDQWGSSELQPWLEHRRTLPVGGLICVLDGPTAGRPMSDSCARRELHKLGERAGVRRRIAPHQLRHAHACELAREGVGIHILQRQLGHANLAVTATYLTGINPVEVIDTINARPVPMVPARSGG